MKQPDAQLSAQRLAGQLGARGEVAAAAVGSLYDALTASCSPTAQESLARWKARLRGACGFDPDATSQAVERLAACYGLPKSETSPAELLFSVHTYYALLTRLVVWQWTASLADSPTPAERFAVHSTGESLKDCIAGFESGQAVAGVPSIFQGDMFSWYTAAWSEALARAFHHVAGLLADWQPEIDGCGPEQDDDLLTDLYQAVFPKTVRHGLGEYYTPGWLAEHVLDEAGYEGDPDARLLDPTCGSGRFLRAAIRRVRRRQQDVGNGRRLSERELCRRILAGVVGWDLHPLAVLSARANYLIALGGLARHLGDAGAEIPVRTGDSILRPEDDGSEPRDRFDFVVGNPPWIAWDHLPADYREATKPLWRRYGLFSLSASDARHGGGKKDLAMLVLYRTADRDLKLGGRLAMVTTQTVFQSKGAGDGFRRFRLGADGPPLAVLRVNDLVEARPFADAANWTSTIVLEKGRATEYPVPYIKWTHGDCPNFRPSENGTVPLIARFSAFEFAAEPIDPRRPGSPWFLRPQGLDVPLAELTGPSDYLAHLGANTGGASGVYWLELVRPAEGGVLVRNTPSRGKRRTDAVTCVVESKLIYPLLRWGDVGRYRATASGHLLMVQDPNTRQGVDEAVMRRRYPQALAYLSRFRTLLAGRAAYRRYQHHAAFYSMYNVGPYTVAPIKVVWRRMDRRINAAVVEPVDDPLLGVRAVVPQETCVLVAVETADEAHYLCGLLNSAVVNFLVSAHSVAGGKGFGTPSMLDYVRLKQFDPDRTEHAALASASRLAHAAIASGEDLTGIQRQIDRLAAALWKLSDRALAAMRREG